MRPARHRSATRNSAAFLAVALLIAAARGWVLVPDARGAEPYTMKTTATYTVDPAAGTVDVSVAITFTNTTPNPSGRYSLFSTVPVPVQDGTTRLTARDAGGALTAALASGSGGSVATVTLRTPLRYQKTTSFTLAYLLADGANPRIRVRPSAVVVPIWSFGTSGMVSVLLPSGFSVATQGDAMTAASVTDGTVLSSGPIVDPPGWLALLTATRPEAYETVSRSVPLQGGTMDLRVRSWSDDRAWATKTLDLLADGLPALQAQIGLPYAGLGPMVVTESLPAGAEQLAEPTPGAQEIAVSFDAAPFTVLHQAAHIWLGTALIGERWIREGLASEAADRAAQQLGVARLYDPAAQATAHAAAAMPLATWGPRSSDAAGMAFEDWAYAASWDLVNRIVAVVGQEALQQVLLRAQSGIGAYAPTAPGSASASAIGTPLPLDSQRFLDQLEQVSGRDLGGLFADAVFAAPERAQLALRATARTEYAALRSMASDWGMPDTIRSLMAGWHFDDAQTAMAAATAWWQQRDAFITQVRDAGLATPGRLRDLWRSNGGDEKATAELRAEAALVGAYRSAVADVGGDPNPIQRLGLLGMAAPKELLATAAGLFADGDLTGAADRITRAVAADHDAQAAGVVRLAIILAFVAVAAAAVTLLLRRRRRRAA